MKSATSAGREDRLGPWGADLAAFVGVIFRPDATFARLAVRRPLLVPFAAGTVVFLGLAWLSLRVTAVALGGHAGVSPEAEALFARLAPWSVALAPVGFVLRWVAVASVLWATGIVAGAPLTWRGAAVVTAYGATPLVAGEVVDLVGLALTDPRTALDVPAWTRLLSLQGLVPVSAESTLVHTLAGHVHPFSLASLWLWCAGWSAFRGHDARAAWAGGLAWSVIWLVVAVTSHWMQTLSHGALGA